MIEGAPIKVATIHKDPNIEVRICLAEFRGARNIDVRNYVPISAAQVHSPTTKGIALSVEHLPDLIEALQSAEVKARELGWLVTP